MNWALMYQFLLIQYEIFLGPPFQKGLTVKETKYATTQVNGILYHFVACKQQGNFPIPLSASTEIDAYLTSHLHLKFQSDSICKRLHLEKSEKP